MSNGKPKIRVVALCLLFRPHGPIYGQDKGIGFSD